MFAILFSPSILFLAQRPSLIDFAQIGQFFRRRLGIGAGLGRDPKIPAGIGADFIHAGKSEPAIKPEFMRSRLGAKNPERGDDGRWSDADEVRARAGLAAVEITRRADLAHFSESGPISQSHIAVLVQPPQPGELRPCSERKTGAGLKRTAEQDLA
jgi:hypothetical protein